MRHRRRSGQAGRPEQGGRAGAFRVQRHGADQYRGPAVKDTVTEHLAADAAASAHGFVGSRGEHLVHPGAGVCGPSGLECPRARGFRAANSPPSSGARSAPRSTTLRRVSSGSKGAARSSAAMDSSASTAITVTARPYAPPCRRTGRPRCLCPRPAQPGPRPWWGRRLPPRVPARNTRVPKTPAGAVPQRRTGSLPSSSKAIVPGTGVTGELHQSGGFPLQPASLEE